jgi:hypothetical protein
MSETGGPYVQIAALCEKVLQEKDGVLSVIRVVDQVNITASGVGAPDEMPPGNLNLTAVVSLKAGIARGRYDVKILPVSPSGKNMHETIVSAYFEGDDRGVNVIFNIALGIREEGVFWFEVYARELLLTRIPLRVVYQRLTHSAPGSAS